MIRPNDLTEHHFQPGVSEGSCYLLADASASFERKATVRHYQGIHVLAHELSTVPRVFQRE